MAEQSAGGTMRGLVVLGVLGFLLYTFCFSGESGTGNGSGDSARENSSLACDHFRNIAGDASSGILTDAELREKLKEVDDNASIATVRVRNAARRMLAGATSGSSDFEAAIREMGAACAAAGH